MTPSELSAIEEDVDLGVEGITPYWAEAVKRLVAEAKHVQYAEEEVNRLNRLVDTLSRALARYQDEEDEVGGDDPADHPYQQRGSWSGDDWCAVEGCTSKASAHPSEDLFSDFRRRTDFTRRSSPRAPRPGEGE